MHYFKLLGHPDSFKELWENQQALNLYLARLKELYEQDDEAAAIPATPSQQATQEHNAASTVLANETSRLYYTSNVGTAKTLARHAILYFEGAIIFCPFNILILNFVYTKGFGYGVLPFHRVKACFAFGYTKPNFLCAL